MVSANTASAEIKVAAQLLNLSTRLRVQPGDNALIGGFIIRGSEPKKVILRGIGPSLNVPGKLDDPVIQLFNSADVNIAGNDDWKTDQQNVEATGLAPTNDRESAIVITLDPGNYTVVMRGKNNSSGIGVVDMFDIGLAANARLANVSSRGFIGTGDNVLIGGFFAGPANRGRHPRGLSRDRARRFRRSAFRSRCRTRPSRFATAMGIWSRRTTTGRPTRKPRSKRPACSRAIRASRLSS